MPLLPQQIASFVRSPRNIRPRLKSANNQRGILILGIVLSAFLFKPLSGATVDFNTLDEKVMVGYQGWHWANGDGSPRNRWHHWTRNNDQRPGPNNIHIDMFPDMSEYPESYNTDWYRNGQRLRVYSAADYSTVSTHFRWMKEYNIDGAFVQRFLNGFDGSPGSTQENINLVLGHCKGAAQEHGRTYVVMYDVSGNDDKDVFKDITRDWDWLVGDGYINSPNYLKHNGKPVVSIWGMGFNDRPPTDPNHALSVINWFKNERGCHVMGGVPLDWRTFTVDAVSSTPGRSRTQAGWKDVYDAFNVISPWMVGSLGNEIESDAWRTTLTDDRIHAENLPDTDYMPVAFPGFSWSNWNGGTLNQIPRIGGQFLWRQAYNAKLSGANMLYLAMFDEVDEGTALYKLAPTIQQCPDTNNWVTMDIDGFDLPSDWYLQVSGQINEMFKGERAVVGDLPLLESYFPPEVTVARAPPGNISNTPFNLTLSVNQDFGYYSINGGAYQQFSSSNPAIINVSASMDLSVYGENANGASEIQSYSFIVDTTAPNIQIISGPDSDHTSRLPFNVTLQVDDNSGYWSLNGEPYNEFLVEPTIINSNGDFESGSGTIATGWSQSPSHTRSTDLAYSGSYALKSTYRGAAGLASSLTVAIQPNTDYTLSARIWKDDNNSAAYVDLNDVPGDINLAVENGRGGGEWTYVEGFWNSGSLTSVTIRCVQDGGNITGDMIWDNVHLSVPSQTAERVISITETSTLRFYSEDAIGNNSGVTTINYTISSNDPPVVTSTPMLNLMAGDAYSYTMTATDSDGDALTYSAQLLPAWLSFNPSNQLLSGTPTVAGSYPVTLQVTDGFDPVGQSFTVTVTENLPPYWLNNNYFIANGTEGILYTGSLSGDAVDPEGDTLNFVKTGGTADWLIVSPDGSYQGTPGFGDAGLNTIVVEVDDGVNSGVWAVISINIEQGASTDSYDTWRNIAFTNPTALNTERVDDFDGDGHSNEFEFIFGMDPESASNDVMKHPELVDVSGSPGIRFNTRNDGSVSTYYVDTSSDLINWNLDQRSSEFTDVSINSSGDIDTILIRYNQSYGNLNGGKIFIRLRAVE